MMESLAQRKRLHRVSLDFFHKMDGIHCLKSKPVFKETFRIPKEMGNSAKTAHIVGEFHNWTFFSTPMEKLKNGTFTTTLDLEPGKEYQFRYLLDEKIWGNEKDADKSVSSPYEDCENSVIVI